MVKDNMNGQMVENMKVFLKITKCMEMVLLHGQMGKSIKVIIKMI